MKIGVTSVDVTGHDDGTTFCCDGNKTKESEHCDASQSETAEYTSTFGGIFYGFIVFIGNIVHKLFMLFTLTGSSLSIQLLLNSDVISS